jgi:nucleoside-diphosphate-sugar epimerase
VKVLLTGASGFIGRSVFKLLMRQGIDTVIIGRNQRNRPLDGHYINLDLLGSVNFDDLAKVSGATHLIHLAWYTEYGAYWASPFNLRWIDATVRLVEAFCHAGGQQVIIAGTCAEYDWSYGYCSEISTPLNPVTLYGIAKDTTRRLVTAICAETQTRCAWGRIFSPYGQGEDRRRLIPALIDVFDGKREPFGVNSTAFRDFLHVEDVANGFLTLLQNNANGSFNICSAQPVQIAEIVKLLAQSRHADPAQVLQLNSERPEEPYLLLGDNKKLTALGWSPRHYLREIIGKEVAE